MKRIFFILAVMFLAASLLHAADNSGKIRLANGNMLYFKTDMWSGLMVASDRNPQGCSVNSEDFKKLIKRIPAAYSVYQASESKRMTGIIILYGSMIGGLGISYLGVSNSNYNVALGMGGLFAMLAGEIVALMFVNDANNLFYRSIHEYNQAMIYVGLRENGTIGLQKNIDF
jgi:hypothetical protein